MIRPYVICHMLQSADGKVTGSFLRSPKCLSATKVYYELNRSYSADAFACGRVTMEESFTGGFYPDLAELESAEVCLEDYVSDKANGFYAVAFDRKGRLGWKSAYIEDEDPGYGGAHIIEVLGENVDSRYLEYLRKIGVSYIFAGKDGSDIPLALSKLAEKFQIYDLLLEGGAELNGAFARAGVIDELSLVAAPIMAEKTDKPLLGGELAGEPTFLGATEHEGGAVAFRYKCATWQ